MNPPNSPHPRGASAGTTTGQAGGGHNLSLGLSAMAYHLKVLSFTEECVLARENTDATSRDGQAGAAAPAPLAGD